MPKAVIRGRQYCAKKIVLCYAAISVLRIGAWRSFVAVPDFVSGIKLQNKPDTLVAATTLRQTQCRQNVAR